MAPAVDWSQEKCLELISKFKTHPALWNRNAKEFHNPKKKEDEWQILSREIGAPLGEVKKKIECLRGSYRRERSKVRTSKDVYSPKWFAYKHLEFLVESMNYSPVFNFAATGNHDGVSPGKVPSEEQDPLCQKRNSDSMDSDEYILPTEASKIFPMKVINDSEQPKPQSVNMELSFHNKQTTQLPQFQSSFQVLQNDSLNRLVQTPPILTFKEAPRSPKLVLRKEIKLEDEIQSVSRNATPIRISRNSAVTPISDAPSKLLKIPAKEIGLSERIKRDVLSPNRIEFPPRKRRMFRSGPYRPIRPKPKPKDGKAHKELKTLKKYSGRKIVRVSTSNVDIENEGVGLVSKEGDLDRISGKPQCSPVEDVDSDHSATTEPSLAFNQQLGRNESNETSADLKLTNSHKQEDECTAFGQLVESSLRRLPDFQRIRAKMKLSQVLWDLEMEALNPVQS